MQLETIIGLEIHVQLKTKSKMFCSCANIFGDVTPNTAICPICLGYPGTLPVPNATAIEWTQRAGAALNCRLAEHSKFDRKHYFYPDLPKGYQISQYDQPFCGEGYLEIVLNDTVRRIGIERIHLEEDAAKNIHPKDAKYTLVDYNRAGTPLMEIVTKPDLRSPEEAKLFLQELQRIMRALGVSDADMEKGHMRCDANISLRPIGESELHPKTEIKNVNSFRFVERALQYEIKRQTKEWEKDSPPTSQSTRGYSADKGVTIAQRTKEAAADYRYFPDPDIPPFEFTSEELAVIRASVPELPPARRTRLIKQTGISDQHAQLLIDQPHLADFFEATVSELEELDQEEVSLDAADIPSLVTRAANLILRQLRALIDEQHLATDALKITPANFAELVVLIQQERVNKNAVPQILTEMQRTGGDPDHIIDNLGLAQVSDTAQLEQHITHVIEQNPAVVTKVKAGNEAPLQFLMGQVMARTKGTANPAQVIKLLRQELGL